jgi:hypothetical protein
MSLVTAHAHIVQQFCFRTLLVSFLSKKKLEGKNLKEGKITENGKLSKILTLIVCKNYGINKPG